MFRLGGSKSCLYPFDLGFRRRDPVFRFLLKRVQDINASREPNRIDRAIGVAVMILDDLQHARAAEAL